MCLYDKSIYKHLKYCKSGFCTAVSVIDTKILSTSFSLDKAAAEEERTKRRKKKQRRKNLNGGRYGKKARI